MAAPANFDDEGFGDDPSNRITMGSNQSPEMRQRCRWTTSFITLGYSYKKAEAEDWVGLGFDIERLFEWPCQYAGVNTTKMEEGKLELQNILSSAAAPGGTFPGDVEKLVMIQILRDVVIEMVNHVDGVGIYRRSTVEHNMSWMSDPGLRGKDRIRMFFLCKLFRLVDPREEEDQAVTVTWHNFLPSTEELLREGFKNLYEQAHPIRAST